MIYKEEKNLSREEWSNEESSIGTLTEVQITQKKKKICSYNI